MIRRDIFGSLPFRYKAKVVNMGQCNTQPEDGNNANVEMFRDSTNEKWKGMAYTNLPSPEKMSRNVYETRDVCSNSYRDYGSGHERQDHCDYAMNKVDEWNTPPRHSNQSRNRSLIADSSVRGASHVRSSSKTPSRLSTNNSLSTDTQVSLPDGAVRTRCYRLNLDVGGIVSPTNSFNGPFEYCPATQQLARASNNGATYGEITSNASAETSDESDKQVAIKTAQIFRDLAITDDGNIISMNPRANRGSSKSKVKAGEKSRQAAKIDQAKDLIDEVGTIDKKQDHGEKSNMISLVVLGEYDDMKCLVIEGASTLKDNSIPDEMLLKANAPRRNRSSSSIALEPASSSLSTPGRAITPSKRSGSIPRMPQSCPPKLKSHPRDLSRTRRNEFLLDLDKGSMSKQSCNDLIETLLNCGPSGKSVDSRNVENTERG